MKLDERYQIVLDQNLSGIIALKKESSVNVLVLFLTLC